MRYCSNTLLLARPVVQNNMVNVPIGKRKLQRYGTGDPDGVVSDGRDSGCIGRDYDSASGNGQILTSSGQLDIPAP
jgi:hypothetical protein